VAHRLRSLPADVGSFIKITLRKSCQTIFLTLFAFYLIHLKIELTYIEISPSPLDKPMTASHVKRPLFAKEEYCFSFREGGEKRISGLIVV
jgi:hypothetical protein